MRKLLGIIFFSFFIFNSIFAEERSAIEIKNGIFLKDVEAFGTFNEIDTAPLGMFKPRDNQFVQMSKYSQGKIGLIFVHQKGTLDKFPENLMLGMGYFEFFYMQQLKDHKKDIKNPTDTTEKIIHESFSRLIGLLIFLHVIIILAH